MNAVIEWEQYEYACCNYNIVFQKLEIKMVKMRLVLACYTSGRGASNLFDPSHYIIYKHIIVLDIVAFYKKTFLSVSVTCSLVPIT